MNFSQFSTESNASKPASTHKACDKNSCVFFNRLIVESIHSCFYRTDAVSGCNVCEIGEGMLCVSFQRERSSFNSLASSSKGGIFKSRSKRTAAGWQRSNTQRVSSH